MIWHRADPNTDRTFCGVKIDLLMVSETLAATPQGVTCERCRVRESVTRER